MSFENLEELRVAPEETPKRRKSGFIILPKAWLHIINEAKPPLSGAAWTVAVRLLELFRLRQTKTVALGNDILVSRGVGRWAKTTALARLSELGLIKVATKPGGAPRVTALADPYL
jgi:hypothetical protein